MIANDWSGIAGKWANEEIRSFPYLSLNEYSDKSVIIRDVIVDPQRIVGSSHSRYVGLSWRKFLLSGKRITHNISRYKENPNYFGTVRQQNSNYCHWTLAQIGEKYYICEGNHRSIIAKYLAHEHNIRSQLIPKVIQIIL